MKILVTGGLGFVGINLVRFLAAQPGTTVIAADLAYPDEVASSFLQPVADSLISVRLDITDRKAVRSLGEDQRITHIVHAAAITATDEQEAANPTLVVDVNLGGTLSVLDAAIATPAVERLIHVSSSGVYSVDSARLPSPLPEDGPLDLNNLYAITKYSSELLTERYAVLSGKMMTSVRLASVYGPMERPSGSRPHTSLMNRLRMAWADGKPIRVAGPDVSRDWIHTEDVARALWMLLNAPAWRHSVYNVSSGIATPLRELVDHFAVHDLQAQWMDDPAVADIAVRPNQMRVPLDITRLSEETGFAPSIDLAAGIRSILSTSV
jgi:UDP-glucose 4-epimerase